MEVDILINLLEEHNEGSILVSKKFKPREVIFLYEEKNKNILEAMKNYYKDNLPLIKFNAIKIKKGEVERLEEIIRINKNKKLLVNLTGGSRINSIILLNTCKNYKVKSIFINIKDKILYVIDEDIKIIREEYEDLELSSILKASGKEIVYDSSEFLNNKNLEYITKNIYKNLDIWHKYKQRLYDIKVFSHSEEDNKRIIIKTKLLDNDERKLLDKILLKLREMQEIAFKNISDSEIEVKFKNDYLKPFIFKTGTWLEFATRLIISEIEGIDEVKSGLVFLWDYSNSIIKNEVDVVAVKDSVVSCISCKDSEKYDEDALNELNVYALKIGGEDANKILVATKEPIKNTIKERVKEMNISLIIFDGNEEEFKKEIKKAIYKNNKS
ncbi:Card1-like endonuclease domain-containing protein [Clostridium isatidis]|uniref:DUF1887 domain-containing protein n=1 Tax=Clostridium isatidis TaxID=182773 RepID=A0A343J8X3_9CLOT|nr:DUF1887 family CARF protein [Clostridium isatidis]ASW41981.1 hypothetical protein BEN51_00185 [Clostridium isatidis]